MTGYSIFADFTPITHENEPAPEWILLDDPTGTYRPGARFTRYDLVWGIAGEPGGRAFAIGTRFQSGRTGQVKRVAASPRFFRSRARLVVE